MDEIAAIFGDMGFTVAEGPDIEDDWHNFTALNIPPDHPARQMQDTFYLPRARRRHAAWCCAPTPRRCRRAPCSTASEDAPRSAIIVPGRTFRIDYDATHTPMFHQVEGLVIDRDNPHGPPQGLPGRFLPRLLRGRRPAAALPPLATSPSPSRRPRSISAARGRAASSGSATATTGWRSWARAWCIPTCSPDCGLDPDDYQGFAFGMGIDRIAMLKYGIPDLRSFFDSDLRWLRHYGFSPLDVPSLTGGLGR